MTSNALKPPSFPDLDTAPPRRSPWMITFVDLATLLLAFFVLMFSMSNVRPTSYRALAEAFSEAFGLPVVDRSGPKIELPEISIIPGDNLSYLAAVLSATFAQTPALSDVEFHLTSQYLKLSLPDRPLFAPGSNAFLPGARDLVFSLGGVLSNLKNRVAVVGTAATGQGAGGDAEKWNLAVSRAQAMAEALKMAGYKLDITTFGEGGYPTDVAAALGHIDIFIMPERPAS